MNDNFDDGIYRKRHFAAKDSLKTDLKLFGQASRQSNGRSNPEVVGSIPTEVKRFFLYLVCLTFTRAQWVTSWVQVSTLNYTSELILCST